MASRVKAAWSLFLSDFSRYRVYRKNNSTIVIILTEQALWAIFVYRFCSEFLKWRPNRSFHLTILAVSVGAQKIIEVLTGISLPPTARIGPGLYIGHFGNIIINPEAIIGPNCNISQGVTIGVSGVGANRGVPVIGERVFIGANAVVAGKLEIGDDAVIAACSLVTRDMPAKAVAMGVPAQIVNFKGSAEWINPTL